MDTFTMKAEFDGGVCRLCGCWILAGDLLIIDQEKGLREHKVCKEAREHPERVLYS